MIKIIKFKILSLIADKYFKYALILFFIILNYRILISSGLLTIGNETFNQTLKYTLLINNIIYVSMTFGLLLSLYIGAGVIGKDVSNNQIFLILCSAPRRWKYFISIWSALILLLFIVLVLLVINYIIIAIPLDIKTNNIDFARVISGIYLNFAVIMTVAAMASTFIRGYGSGVVGLLILVIFQIHTTEQIPLINVPLELNYHLKKFLVNIAPIREIYDYSITNTGVINRFVTTPLFINNFAAYQIIYIAILLLLSIIIFQNADL